MVRLNTRFYYRHKCIIGVNIIFCTVAWNIFVGNSQRDAKSNALEKCVLVRLIFGCNICT